MSQAHEEMLGLQEQITKLELDKQRIIAEASYEIQEVERESDRVRRNAEKERLRLINEAEIALRAQ